MKSVNLKLANVDTFHKDEPLWVLTIDGRPFPSGSAASPGGNIMSYDMAISMIKLNKDIEYTVGD